MTANLATLEAQHEALIAALDGHDAGAIEAAGSNLADSLKGLQGSKAWLAEPELKLVAERIGRLAEAALMRVHLLTDQNRRRADTLAAMRGQPVSATYSR